MNTKRSLLFFAICFFFTQVFSLDNGLSLTPPMGWLTWERFRCNTDCKNDYENCISEHLIKVMADEMVSRGYLSVGYEYIIVDDCWLSKSRDPITGKLLPDPERFPSGIKLLADYVHSKGLKFGIYEDYGTLTCGGYPGSIDHLELDAQTFAEWGVDYVKLDGCYADIKQMDTGYPQMGEFLNKTNRPMVYSCSWPAYQEGTIQPNYEKIAKYCNLWRNYDDIQDSFDSFHNILQWYAKKQDNLSINHGPGHWNDPDMLLIGNFGLSINQAKAQMALWSLLSAPLIMSNDLRNIDHVFEDILKNKFLIGINKDKLGIMGKRFNIFNGVELWSKPLIDEKKAFVFYNPQTDGTPRIVTISLKEMGIDDNIYNFFDSFNGEFIGKFDYSKNFEVMVNPAGSVFAFWVEKIKKDENFLKI